MARLPLNLIQSEFSLHILASSTRFALMFQNSSHVFLLVLPLLSYNFGLSYFKILSMISVVVMGDSTRATKMIIHFYLAELQPMMSSSAGRTLRN